MLLTVPIETIMERLAARTTNDFGKDPSELANTLALIEEVEPLLRRSADVENDTTRPLDEVVDLIPRLAGI